MRSRDWKTFLAKVSRKNAVVISLCRFGWCLSGRRRNLQKKKTKLPGQPKRPMSAYFLWLNSEGRDKIKVFLLYIIHPCPNLLN